MSAAPPRCHRVFVYGSLKRDFANHAFLETSRLLGETVTEAPVFRMVSLGAFPAVIAGECRIKGELYEVDGDTFKELDRLESNGTLYQRIRVSLQGETKPAWMYLFMHSTSSVAFATVGVEQETTADGVTTQEWVGIMSWLGEDEDDGS